ncbi:MAG TPA: vWA domain-containing protein, partial [Polyangiaceae bacterium]|nr:vWA domain-containing protein [Polyangiaceae bacterium]
MSRSMRCLLLLALLGASACSANSDPIRNEIGEGRATGGAGSGGSSGGGKSGAVIPSSNTEGTGVPTDGTGGRTPDPGVQGCATSSKEAELTPVYQVFVYDKSASMGDDPNGQWQNRALRWDPLKQGMIDYFTNSGQTGVQASLEFFPAPGGKTQTCQANYASPSVPLTPLEKPATLIAALEAASPSGGTPTLSALYGAFKYAGELQAKNKAAKAMVVLVTDGEPAIYNADTMQIETDCAPVGSTLTNTIPDIATLVAQAFQDTPSISTYVIGVGSGDSLSSLATIAAAGGTELVLIDPVDPTRTRADLTERLRAIRSKHLSCDIAVPEPPPGQTLDPSLINVDLTHGNGQHDELYRSDDCSRAGWRYDKPINPARIELCPTLCTSLESDPDAKLDLVLG